MRRLALTDRPSMREDATASERMSRRASGSVSVSTTPCSWNRTSDSVARAMAPAVSPENSNSQPDSSSGVITLM